MISLICINPQFFVIFQRSPVQYFKLSKAENIIWFLARMIHLMSIVLFRLKVLGCTHMIKWNTETKNFCKFAQVGKEWEGIHFRVYIIISNHLTQNGIEQPKY